MSEDNLKPLFTEIDNEVLSPLSTNTRHFSNDSDEESVPVIETIEEDIQNKDSKFVLFFGSAYSGKSVILASLLYYLKTKEGVLEINPSKTHTKEERMLISDFLDNLRKGELPERTTLDKVTQLDFTFKPNNKSKKVRPINLSFLETAGDNNYQIRRGGSFHDSLDSYLNSNISLTIVLVTSYDNANREDTFIDEFLSSLKEKVNLKSLKIILVISKWDISNRMRVSNEIELENFIKRNLPMTYSAMNTYGMAKTYYTIGEVAEVDGRKKITKLNLYTAEKLSKWIYKSIVGYPLDYEGTLWERIKFSFTT